MTPQRVNAFLAVSWHDGNRFIFRSLSQMKSDPLIIIGGGAIGLSVACHLAWRGEQNIVLLERHQLTSGTSWHAAGIVGPFRATPALTRLAMYAGELFPKLEQQTGMATGYRVTGGYWLARRAERMDELHRIAALGRHLGVHPEFATSDELAARLPLLDRRGLIAAMSVAEDATVNPVDLCMAYAAAARAAGVQIREGVQVSSLDRKDGRLCGVELANGCRLPARCVALCAGAWSRHLAQTAGVKLPLQAVEHMYVVTEAHDSFSEFPVVRDLDHGIYVKGDTGKLVIGGFEPDAKLFDVNSPAGQRAFVELPEDWSQFEPFMRAALQLIPTLENVGIQHFMNGPESFTADTKPLVGATTELDNLYVAAGMNSVGVMSSAGIGKVLADWIVDEQPPHDLWEIDVARADPLCAGDGYLGERMREAVADQFAMHWPYKQPVFGRDLRRSALHQRWADAGAVFGLSAGWERALWYANTESEQDFPYSIAQQAWQPIVLREARQLEHGTVLLDLSPFSKFEVSGAQALKSLDRLSSASLDVRVGRAVYTQLLNCRAGIEADVTVSRLAADRFRIMSAAATRWRDHAWLRRQLPGSVTLRDYTEECCVIGVMGGASRSLLESIVCTALPLQFASVAEVEIAGVICLATRLSFVGEFGWELEIALEHAASVFDCLRYAGARPMGHYALDGCRLEKGYRHWGHDIGPSLNPVEAGLGFTVNNSESRLHHHIAAEFLESATSNFQQRLYLCQLHGTPLMLHDELVWQNGNIVGLTTSGGVGPRTGITLAFVLFYPDAIVETSRPLQIEVADQRYDATVLERPPFDPDNLRMQP